MQKKTVGAKSPSALSFPPSAPPAFDGRRLLPRAEEMRGQDWTPEDVLMVAGKSHLLSVLPDAMYNIAKVGLFDFLFAQLCSCQIILDICMHACMVSVPNPQAALPAGSRNATVELAQL